MDNAKATPTPLPTGYQPSENTAPVAPLLRTRFQQIIGSLMYLMIGTHPDIAFAVIKLSQFAANPSQEHIDKALYICWYLVGTSDYASVFDSAKNKGIQTYTDSDWAADTIQRRSQTGYMITLASGVISWQSWRQKTVALSSTEAEYMAMSDLCCQISWTLTLLREIGFDLLHIPIAADNQGSIFIAQNPVQEKRSKHIDIKYHYIWECIKEGKVSVFFIEGIENPADMFTKNLGAIKFHKFQEHLGLEFYSPKSAIQRKTFLAKGSVKITWHCHLT
jgi:hypothetical protein